MPRLLLWGYVALKHWKFFYKHSIIRTQEVYIEIQETAIKLFFIKACFGDMQSYLKAETHIWTEIDLESAPTYVRIET